MGYLFGMSSDVNSISAIDNSYNISDRIKNYDIYISSGETYTIEDIIYGNVFVSTKNFNIYPKKQEDIVGGILSGSLFVKATNINIQSETITNEDGTVSLNPSIIYGNIFAIADNFILDSECQVYGDLYIIANNVKINQNAEIRGSVFTTAQTVNIDGKIGGDLYAKCKNFNMNFDGLVTRDLHVVCKDAFLERNCL